MIELANAPRPLFESLDNAIAIAQYGGTPLTHDFGTVVGEPRIVDTAHGPQQHVAFAPDSVVSGGKPAPLIDVRVDLRSMLEDARMANAHPLNGAPMDVHAGDAIEVCGRLSAQRSAPGTFGTLVLDQPKPVVVGWQSQPIAIGFIQDDTTHHRYTNA